VSLWHVDDLTLLDQLPFDAVPGQSNWINDLALSPDSTMLVAGHWNGTLELWQVRQ
jgi:WD40 repeat protein